MNKKVLLLSVLGLLTFQYIYSYPGKVINSVNTPGNFPTGLTWDGTNLWVADRAGDKLYCLDKLSGNIIRSIPSPAYWPAGLTWDGEYLWNIDLKGGIPLAENYQAVVYKIDPSDGKILHTVPAPASWANALCWDGKYLWCSDPRNDELIQFDPNDGTTIKTIPAPYSDCRGLTWDGTYLWCSDRISDEIYMVDTKDGTVHILTDAPGNFAMDMAYDGKYLWNVDHENKRIYKLVRKDTEKLRLTQAIHARITYTHQCTNFGPGNVNAAQVHLAIPVNRDNQTINSIKYIPEPDKIMTDQWGQQTAYFAYSNLKAGEKKTVQMTTDAIIYASRYFIYPDEIGSLKDIPKDISSLYLIDDVKYQVNSDIIQAALKEAIGDETNPYWIVRDIYHYLMKHMYYEMVGGWNTAPTVLERGNGSCSEYTFVFISMCRAAGIPARYVGSVVVRGDISAMDDVFHRWVEVYLPNYGWIPVDPSGGDSDSPRHQALYFGGLANRFLITTESGGGSSTMNWTYNSNEFWQSDAKTYVVFENFADWESVEE